MALNRLQTASDKIYSIQVLRFVAAAMVAALHINQSAHWQLGLTAAGFLPNVGSFGVDAFFVVSGFIIAKTAPGHSPRQFFAKRFARVVPFYWIMTALYVPLLIQADMFRWTSGIATATFYPGIGRPWLGVGWTLCFEMLFYTVTALVLFNPRRLIPLVLGIYALCWIARIYVGGPFEFFGNPIILEFLAGAALAQTRPRSRLLGCAFIVLSLVALSFIGVYGIGKANWVRHIIDGQESLVRIGTMGVAASMLVFGTMQFQIRPGILTYLGDASYSMYLTHRPAIGLVRWVGPILPLGIFIPAVGLLALSFSILAYECIEKPVVSWARNIGWHTSRLFSRPTAAHQPATPEST
jgi:exopolysaccharide production protein ExoZ